MEPFDTLQREWRVISKAPWSFLIVTAAIAAILYGIFHWEYGAQIEHLKGLAEQKVSVSQEAPAVPVTPQQTVNAENGIGTIGGTLVNPQVNNNFAPPPAKIACSVRLLSRSGDKRTLELRISTDRTIKAPEIGFILSGPFNDTDAYWRVHPPVLGGYRAPAYNWGKLLDSKQHPIPNSFGIELAMPSAINPGSDLVLTIEANVNSRVLGVGEIGNPMFRCF